jgi:tetratricopeptide (TPR) repeat protein
VRWPANAAALAVGAAALWWAAAVLVPWVASGRFPGADAWTARWPALVALATAAGFVLGLVRRAPLATLAGGLVCGATLALVAAELPHASSNARLGDGPFLMPVYAALVTALAVYVPAGPRGHGASGRLLVAAVVVCGANTQLFARASATPVALVLCLALLALAEAPRRERADPLLGAGRLRRALVAVSGLLVLWILAAALLGDSLVIGLRHWHAVLAGATLACALATALDRRGALRIVGTLVAVALAIAVCGVLAEFDLAAVEGWQRTLATRLRLFDLHPNQIGPCFAGGAVLCGTLLVARPVARAGARAGAQAGARAGGWPGGHPAAWLATRALLALTLGASLWLLWRTDSRASQFGAAVGVAAAALAVFAPVPRRPKRLLVGAGVLALLALVLWWTPASDGLRTWLETKTFEANSAIGQRYHFWRMAADVVAAEPLFGGGPGQNYVHAQYAQSSYFDGARQTFHAHNLLFALAEGSGLPSLALFLALLVLLLETYRRLVVGAARAERALVAAPLVASLAMLASNLLDLGQVQPTYLPLHLWITLGLGVALARETGPAPAASAAPQRPRTGPCAALGGLVLVAFGLLPLVADGLIHSGRLLTFTAGEPERGYARLVAGRRLFPPHPDAFVYDRSALARLDAPDEAQLDVLRKVARREPGNARAWLDLAVRLARSVHHVEARAAVERALALDPRGLDVGEAYLVRLTLDLRDGWLEAARESLHAALVHQATQWQIVPSRREQVAGLHRAAAHRTIFSVRSHAAALVELPLDEGLERLGAEALELARTNPPFARRYLASLHEAYMQEDRPEAALVWFERYREVVPEPIPSVLKLEWILLQALGREAEADALLDLLDGPMRELLEDDLSTTLVLMRPAQVNAMGPEAVEELIAPLAERDAFGEVGLHTAKYELAMRIFLRSGRHDRAIDMARRIMREFQENGARRDTMEQLVTRFIDSKVPGPVLLELLRHTIVEQNVDTLRRAAREREVFVIGVAQHVHARWLPDDGDLVARARRAVAGTGPAADAFLLELERLDRLDRGEE